MKHGDVIEYKGVKYRCQGNSALYERCKNCVFNGGDVCLVFDDDEVECIMNHHYVKVVPVKQRINSTGQLRRWVIKNHNMEMWVEYKNRINELGKTLNWIGLNCRKSNYLSLMVDGCSDDYAKWLEAHIMWQVYLRERAGVSDE